MNVTHIVPAIAEEASGPSYSVVRLCESLIDNGQEVTLAALDWSSLTHSPPFLKTFTMGLWPRRLGVSSAMHQWLVAQCKLSRTKILHNHGMWQLNSLYPAWAVKGTGVKLIYSPRGAFSPWAMNHGSVMKRIFWPVLQRPAVRQADLLHATAESEYEEIRQLGFRQPVAIIPNGIDILTPSAHFEEDDQRRLLFLSRIHKKKGLENLLRAWSRLENDYPNWRLDIVGSDEGYHRATGYLEELKSLSNKLQLKSVHFLGGLHGEAKRRAYTRAEVLVLPTFSENFGMVVAEALSMATPAIVTKGAPWSGLVKQGAGWWIEIGEEPLVTALRDALSRTPAELAAMGQRGRLWMQQEFSWPSIGNKMAETYRWLYDRSLPVPAWVRLD